MRKIDVEPGQYVKIRCLSDKKKDIIVPDRFKDQNGEVMRKIGDQIYELRMDNLEVVCVSPRMIDLVSEKKPVRELNESDIRIGKIFEFMDTEKKAQLENLKYATHSKEKTRARSKLALIYEFERVFMDHIL